MIKPDIKIKMKKFLRHIIHIWTLLMTLPLRLFRGRAYCNVINEIFMQETCKNVEQLSNLYMSVNLRPKKIENNRQVFISPVSQTIAVILQGPLLLKDDFTLNTVRYYLKSNPNLKVIVSTWEGENDDALEKIKIAGACVVQSELPVESGHRNINYQLVSMQAGIRKALEARADYICKTRTDQRIENPDAFTFMKSMINLFPVSEHSHFKKRIVALGAEHGSMFNPYYISDFVYFGTCEDMKLMLSIPMRKKRFIEKTMSRKDASMNKTSPEAYIIKTLFEISGTVYCDTIDDYWKSIKDSLVLMDMSILGIYWPKYDARYCEHTRNGTYAVGMSDEVKLQANFNFSTWLALINGDIAYHEVYEKLLTHYIQI